MLISTGQLVLSAIFAAIVGYEREMHGRPAGLRTHVLVGVGATLFTLSSVAIASGENQDPGRISAQIVSGIGFLGAGTIIQQGSIVRGLTTAATLWAVAGVGIAVGVGGHMLGVATIATIVIYTTLTLLRRLEYMMDRHRESRELVIICSEAKQVMRKVVDVLDDLDVEIRNSTLSKGFGGGVRGINMRLWRRGGMDVTAITRQISEIPEVVTIEWQ